MKHVMHLMAISLMFSSIIADNRQENFGDLEETRRFHIDNLQITGQILLLVVLVYTQYTKFNQLNNKVDTLISNPPIQEIIQKVEDSKQELKKDIYAVGLGINTLAAAQSEIVKKAITDSRVKIVPDYTPQFPPTLNGQPTQIPSPIAVTTVKK